MIDKEVGEIVKLAAQIKDKADKMLKGPIAKLQSQDLTKEQRQKLDKALRNKEIADKRLNDFLKRM